MRLHPFLPPEIGIRGSDVIEERGFKKGLWMGIKTDLRKFLNRLIITLFGQILKNAASAKKLNWSQFLPPKRIDLNCPMLLESIFAPSGRSSSKSRIILVVAHMIDIPFKIEIIGKLLLMLKEEGISILI